MDNKVEPITAAYVGDPADDFSGPSKIEMFGLEFTKGEMVEIEDATAIRKIKGHSHFHVEGDDKPEASAGGRDDLATIGAGTGGLDALKDLAKNEGVDFDEEKATKASLIKAIRAKRKHDANA